jgi:predicted ribosomally synthesized peptide with nif11-like leader
MSQEMALAFIDQVNHDLKLQTKLVTQTGNVQGLINVAAEAGYPFTAQDWWAVVKTAYSHEMDEAELEAVVGAGSFPDLFGGFNWQGLGWNPLDLNAAK